MRPVECAIKLSYSDSRLIHHDEDTLTGSECVVGEDTDMHSDESKNSYEKFINNIYLIFTLQN